MADRSAASIHIGGCIKRSRVPALLAVIKGDDIYRYDGDVLGLIDTEEKLRAVINEHGILFFNEHSARGGEFELLEKFLNKEKIPYVRYTDALPGMWDWQVAFLDPRDQTPTALKTDEDGVPVIPAYVATRAFRALARGDTHAALTELSPYANWPEVPVLPPFSIVEDE